MVEKCGNRVDVIPKDIILSPDVVFSDIDLVPLAWNFVEKSNVKSRFALFLVEGYGRLDWPLFSYEGSVGFHLLQ